MWIALAVLAVLLFSSMLSGSGGFKSVDTAIVLQAINDDKVKSAKLVGGSDHNIQLTLKDGEEIEGSDRIRAEYIEGAGPDLQTLLEERTREGQIPEGFNVDNPRQNVFVSLLLSLLPFILIIVIFLFLMNQMQGGGSRVMNFGRSKAKLVSKDTPKTKIGRAHV